MVSSVELRRQTHIVRKDEAIVYALKDTEDRPAFRFFHLKDLMNQVPPVA